MQGMTGNYIQQETIEVMLYIIANVIGYSHTAGVNNDDAMWWTMFRIADPVCSEFYRLPRISNIKSQQLHTIDDSVVVCLKQLLYKTYGSRWTEIPRRVSNINVTTSNTLLRRDNCI